jgi:hypothetical protein
MAIAPLPEMPEPYGEGELHVGPGGAPWARPALRVVPADVPLHAADRRPTPRGRAARMARLASRARARRRRRTVLLGAAVGAAVVGLALPVSALGGAPEAGPGATSGRAAGAAVYVVRPGDTLWSIASRLDAGGDPRPLAEAIAREIGSTSVVPGERIAIP